MFKPTMKFLPAYLISHVDQLKVQAQKFVILLQQHLPQG